MQKRHLITKQTLSVSLCGVLTAFCLEQTPVYASSDDEVIHFSSVKMAKIIDIDWDESFEEACLQWQETLTKLRPVLISNANPPRLFISYAWHEENCERENPKQLRDAKYLDTFCMGLFLTLRAAGFDVLFDKDQENPFSIHNMTPEFFMNEIRKVDVVLSVCTETYHNRSFMPGSGVKKEVDAINEKWEEIKAKDMKSYGFYVPLLVHASDPNFPIDQLLVGNADMKKAMYVDLRHRHRFTSNMWLALYRLCSATSNLWPKASRLKYLRQYGKVLGDLLPLVTTAPLAPMRSVSDEDAFRRLYRELENFADTTGLSLSFLTAPTLSLHEQKLAPLSSPDTFSMKTTIGTDADKESIDHDDIDGFLSMARKGKAEAITSLLVLAQTGNVLAQYNLGLMYYNGTGVEKDQSEAAQWYRRAADQGHANAQYYLGFCYANGLGVIKNDFEALRFYRLSTDQNHPSARESCEEMYKKKRGDGEEEEEAMRQYRIAAENGDANSQYHAVCKFFS